MSKLNDLIKPLLLVSNGLVVINAIYFFPLIRGPDFDGSVCTEEWKVFRVSGVTETTCAMECIRKFGCYRVFYQPLSGECIGCMVTKFASENFDLVTYKGSQQYKIANYLGCHIDDRNETLKNGVSFDSARLTTKLCLQHCQENGYRYFETKDGRVCVCGNTLNSSGSAGTGCDVSCAGNPKETCGGVGHGRVYDARPWLD